MVEAEWAGSDHCGTSTGQAATQPGPSARCAEQPYATRIDASSAGHPFTSCPPAEFASVSPTHAILLNLDQAVQRKIAALPTVSKLVSHTWGQGHFDPECVLHSPCPKTATLTADRYGYQGKLALDENLLWSETSD